MDTSQEAPPAFPVLAAQAAPAREESVFDKLQQITMHQAAVATVIVLGLGAAFWMTWRFRFVLFALVTAIFLHIAMKPAVDALFRRGVRRALGVFAVYLLVLAALVGLLVTIVPMLAQQAGAFAAELPDYYRLARNFMLQSEIDLLPRLARLLPPAWDMASLQNILRLSTQSGAAAPSPWLLVGRVGQGIFYTIAVFAMALYLTLDRDRILYNLLLRLPIAQREPVEEFVVEVETKVGAFIRGQLILCGVIGALSLVAYLIIGLPYAVALGALAFVFEAIPLVGPLLAAVAAGIVAATVSPSALLWTLVASTIIQMAENNVLVPRIMDKTVGVNAIVSILAITAFTLVFGILGALLAIPLAAVIQIFIDRYLFTTGSQAADVEAAMPAALEEGGTRGEIDVLRLEAAELAQDVRKQQRTSDTGATSQIDALEDLIELTANDLVALLSPAAPVEPASAAVPPAGTAGLNMGARQG